MRINWLSLVITLGIFRLEAADAPLAKELEALRPFVGKTWRGHFKSSTPEKPRVDISRWERALNGKAVRILHSVNDGAYGGETIIIWNRKAERLEFHYFTTAGFTTHGTMKVDGKKIVTREVVTGSDTGISEVEATTELLANGKLHMKSRYLKNGEWTDGHDILYEEAPAAEVMFK